MLGKKKVNITNCHHLISIRKIKNKSFLYFIIFNQGINKENPFYKNENSSCLFGSVDICRRQLPALLSHLMCVLQLQPNAMAHFVQQWITCSFLLFCVLVLAENQLLGQSQFTFLYQWYAIIQFASNDDRRIAAFHRQFQLIERYSSGAIGARIKRITQCWKGTAKCRQPWHQILDFDFFPCDANRTKAPVPRNEGQTIQTHIGCIE